MESGMGRCVGRIVGWTLAVFLAAAGVASAATITVNTTADTPGPGGCAGLPGDCSLRQAVAIADGNADPSNTVMLPTNQSHYVLSHGVLTISKTLILQGSGASGTVIDGSNASRIFMIVGGSAVATTINDVTITNGFVKVTGFSQGGAGIYNMGGALTLNRDTLTNNNATTTGGCCNGGGAIFNEGDDLTIAGSTLNDNSFTQTGVIGSCCDGGGAVHTEVNGGQHGSLIVSNSTADGNTMTVTGDDSCCIGGGAFYTDTGNMTLTDTHVDGNTATIDTSTGCCNGGGGAYSDSGSMTVTGGTANNNVLHWDSQQCCNGGGGLYNDVEGSASTMTVTGTSVDGNTATQTSGGATSDNGGGGIFQDNVSGGFVLTGATVAGNSATVIGATASNGGGGVFDDADGVTATIESVQNSTIASNTLSVTGATTDLGGSGYFDSGQPTTFTNATLAGNSGNVSGGIFAGGTKAAVTLRNTIVAGNSGGSCAAGTGSFSSGGHNIDSGNTCGLAAAGDKKNTDPMLGPLQNNGGPTDTEALLPGSPAIDGGDTAANCPATDQRGLPRPDGGEPTCDIGAYEYQNALSVSLSGTGSGTVTSNAAGISCPGTCSGTYPSGTNVTLTATPAGGSGFAGWSGACSGTGTCTFTTNTDLAVTATFTLIPRAKITKAKIERNHHRAKFSFQATGATGFQCALVKKPTKKHKKTPTPQFRNCTSLKTYKNLIGGKYIFEVRALFQLGAGPVATHKFRI